MRKDKINPTFDDFVVVSRKQVELAIFIRQYRRINHLSQHEMAEICSIIGAKHNIKFLTSEISNYENYKTIPRPYKFQILMQIMDITPSMLK